MRACSAALAAALTGAHRRAVRVDMIHTATGATVGSLPVTAGWVEESTADPFTWSAEVEVSDLSLAPTTYTDHLSGFAGVHLRVHLGAVVDGEEDLIRVCDVWPVRSEVTRDADRAAFRVRCASPAAWVSRGGMLTPYLVIPGVTLAVLARDTCAYRLPWPVTVAPGSDTTALAPVGAVLDGDPWDALMNAAAATDRVVDMDSLGNPRVRAPYTLAASDALHLRGGDGGTVTSTASAASTEPAVWANRVRVRFDTPTGTPTVGDAWVSEGPARWGGPAGMSLATEDRPGPATQAQADTYAAGLLAAWSRGVRTTGLTAVPDPRLEAGDTVRVTYANGATERHVVTAVRLPLTPGDMDVGLRGADTPTVARAGGVTVR